MALLQHLSLFLDVRAVLLCVVLLLVIRWFFAELKNLPPGPWGFPIIGSIPALLWANKQGLTQRQLFCGYAAKYGPVFHLKILNKTVVILNDYASVKEAFQHPNLQDRPKMEVQLEAMRGAGIVTASGKPWIELRRFSLNVLRSFGVGKSSFEGKIGAEAEGLIKEISAFDGKPFNPKHLLCNATSNVICSIMFGKRYEYTDKEFSKLLYIMSRNAELLGVGSAVMFIPSLRYLPLVSTKELMSNFEELRKFLANIVDNHRASFDADNLTDFTDALLFEMQQNLATHNAGTLIDGTNPKSRNQNSVGIVGTMADMLLAGTETLATTLQWGLLYMAVYPDIQQRVQAEIDAVVGRNRLPRMADKPELNFTQAVILEIQRVGNVIPMGIAHVAASDTQFRGFSIPKGSFLMSNLWSLFRDRSIWPEPDKMKPERFLNDEGKIVKVEELIPFSTGRRRCIGEHLAKTELFIFFSYFMHQFTFKKPDNSPPPSLEGKGGFTYSPVNFEISAIKRD